jgi:hypothetical protein
MKDDDGLLGLERRDERYLPPWRETLFWLSGLLPRIQSLTCVFGSLRHSGTIVAENAGITKEPLIQYVRS